MTKRKLYWISLIPYSIILGGTIYLLPDKLPELPMGYLILALPFIEVFLFQIAMRVIIKRFNVES